MAPGRKDPRAEPDDDVPAEKPEAPIDIAVAVRAAKTATAHGRAPVPQETTKMGAFDLEQALAKVHAAGKAEGEPPPAPIEEKEEEREPEAPKKAIPIPEPSEPGPMVSSIRDPRVREARGIPRGAIILVVIALALIAGLYAWSRTLR